MSTKFPKDFTDLQILSRTLCLYWKVLVMLSGVILSGLYRMWIHSAVLQPNYCLILFSWSHLALMSHYIQTILETYREVLRERLSRMRQKWMCLIKTSFTAAAKKLKKHFIGTRLHTLLICSKLFCCTVGCLVIFIFKRRHEKIFLLQRRLVEMLQLESNKICRF